MAVDSRCSRPDRDCVRYGRRESAAVGRRHPRTNCRSRHNDNGRPGDNHRDGTVFDNLYEPGELGSVDHPGQPRHVHDKPDTHHVDYDRDVVDDFNLFYHNIEFYNHYSNNCSPDNDVNIDHDDLDDHDSYDGNDCASGPNNSLR